MTDAAYWDWRYASGQTSGAGSYGKNAEYKASVVNTFLAEIGATSVLEFGCGDGNQLSYYHIPVYRGLDVSRKAIELCRKRHPRAELSLYEPGDLGLGMYDATICLEVLMHVSDESEFVRTLDDIFGHASKGVLIQTTLEARPHGEGTQEWHRDFLPYLERYPDFRILRIVEAPKPDMICDFILLERTCN